MFDPSLAGKPIAVGGGVVLAASYEARACGVGAGMPGWQAKRLCPNIQFVGGHFGDYQRLGDQVVAIFDDFTPLVERISIDEAFLDVSGAVHLFGPPFEIAAAIRRRVRAEVGLPVSIGVACTKHLAKVASQVAKPDGLLVVEPGTERAFLDPLPIGLVWGVGRVTEERLHAKGIRTIGELADTDTTILRDLVGDAAGTKLGSLATDIDPRPVEAVARAKSVGAQSALGRRHPTPDLLYETFGFLADRIAPRLRAAGRAGRTVTVRVRFPGMRSITRSTTLPIAVSSTRTLTEIAVALASEAITDEDLTLLAISVSNLVDRSSFQLELPLGFGDDARREATLWSLERSVDAIRAKYGRSSVGYARVIFSKEENVPEEFRSIMERTT